MRDLNRFRQPGNTYVTIHQSVKSVLEGFVLPRHSTLLSLVQRQPDIVPE